MSLTRKNSNKINNKRNNKIKNSNKIKNKTKKGGNPLNLYIFRSNQITNQQNNDNSYKEVGIIHITESGAINLIRSAATGLLNVFGSKGFDNTIYDSTRNLALNKLKSLLKSNQKVCNLRMEIENISQSQLFFIHLYGTLLEK